jgi:hypothetical protein
MFLRNAGWNSTDDTASYPRIWYFLQRILFDFIYLQILGLFKGADSTAEVLYHIDYERKDLQADILAYFRVQFRQGKPLKLLIRRVEIRTGYFLYYMSRVLPLHQSALILYIKLLI